MMACRVLGYATRVRASQQQHGASLMFEKGVDYSDPRSLGARLRKKRVKPLLDLIEKSSKKGAVSILDVGGTEQYWKIVPEEFLEKHNVRIFLLNIPGASSPNCENPRFDAIEGDGCALDYSDASFDIIHSNSVIEHVGDWSRMEAFASEALRVGRSLFIQTPNFWFPVEPHYIVPVVHWLPKPLKRNFFLRFGVGKSRHRAGTVSEAMRMIEREPTLLDRRAMLHLFPDCEIVPERFFLFTKSLIAIRDGSRLPTV